MIKLAVLLKRKQGMSTEDFNSYWEGPHTDLVTSIASFTRHVRRYSLSRIVDPTYGGEGLKWPKAEFDGISEVWFDSIDDMNRAFSEPEFVEKVGPDNARFLDEDAVSMLVTNEIEKVAPNGKAGVKLSVVMRRRSGMTFDEFDHYWLHNHANLALSVPEFTRHLRRYVQCHLVPEYSDPGPENEFVKTWGKAEFDGLAELYFDDIPGMVAAFNEPKFIEIIGPDDPRYTDISRTELMTVQEIERISLKEAVG